ncbi:MAG: TetR/AcrR family transcriptional regulator [Ruminococcaceae bacterium]|nr:TetR/AcrR family transcriptional regulator [Oscillospiraceae bacterium]
MEEHLTADAMRERLIVAGIRELEEHGLHDFSLRRVAVACEVSCAAPYRHFRDKDDLILGIIRYINHRWTLLQDQITSVFPPDDPRLLVELGVAHIRFWIANPNFRSVLLLDDPDPDSPRRAERKKIRDGIDKVIRAYSHLRGLSDTEEQRITYLYPAVIYGTVLLLGNRELEHNEESIRLVRTQLSAILKH